VLGFAVPGLKAIALGPAEGYKERPNFAFSRKGEPVTVDFSRLGLTTFIRLKDIKSSKAEMLKIEGPYLIGATFKFEPEEIAAAEAKRVAETNAGEN